MVFTTSSSEAPSLSSRACEVGDGLARARRRAPPFTSLPSTMPTWPDTTSQSPARTIGVYGPTGFDMPVSLHRRRQRQRVPVGQSVGRARVRARRRRPPPRTPRRSRCTGGPVGRRRSSTSIGGHVDGPQDAEGADREVVHLAVVVDGDALGRHPAQRHVGGAGAVGAQHDLVERVARSHPRRGRCRRRRSRRLGRRRPSSGRPRAPSPPRAPARSTTASAQPAARRSDRRRRAGDVDLLDHQPGGDRGDGRGDARGADHPEDAGAVGVGARRRPAGASGRGARRPRGRAAPAPAGRAGRPARGRRRRPGLAACRRTRRRWRAATPARRRARTTTRRARGRPARPTRPQRDGPVAGGQLERAARRRPWCAGPAPCPRRRGPRPASRRPPSRRRRRAPRPARRPGRCRRRSRPGRARPPGPPAAARPPSMRRPAAAGAPSRSRSADVDGSRRRRRRWRRPTRRGSCASRCSGRGGRAAPARRRRGRPAARALGAQRPRAGTTMPGVQKPHWLAPVAQKASAQRSRRRLGPGRRPS